MSIPHQRHIADFFPSGIILYSPDLARLLGSIPAAIMFSQMLYWQGQGMRPDGYIFKTVEDLEWETKLTRYQQETALKILKKYELIEIKYAGVPRTRCFKIDFVKVQNQLTSALETSGLNWPKPPPLMDDNLRAITEITSKTTSKNTTSGAVSLAELMERKRATLHIPVDVKPVRRYYRKKER